MAFIEIDNLYHTFSAGTQAERTALRGVSLSVEEGEYVALIGANGSGKSTLAMHLNGLLHPTSGSVRIAGLDASSHRNLERVRRAVGLVFQRPEDQIVALTVEQDTAFGPENLRLDPVEIRRRVTRSLETVGLAGLELRSPHSLSAGQKQRLAIAGALALNPRAIVFDEATSMLDPLSRNEVLTLMSDLNGGGTTILHVTHRMEEAIEAARVLVMDSGRIVLDGTPETVFTRGGSALHAVGLPPALELARAVESLSGVDIGNPLTYSALEAALRVGGYDDGRTRRSHAARSGDITDRKAGRRGPGDGRDACDGYGAGGDPATPSVIRTVNLSHSYEAGRVRSLSDVNVDIPRGGSVSVLGATGSGKSTLLQHFNALYFAQRGSVLIDGVPVDPAHTDVVAVRRRIALAFQRPEEQLFSQFVGDEIAYGPRISGLKGGELRERVKWAMETAGLPFDEYKDRLTFGLSGGEQRKVGLALVLAQKPEVLLLDEPTSGLDPHSRRDTVALLDRLHADGATIVMATHDMDEAAERTEASVVLAAGRVLVAGPGGSVFADAEELHLAGLVVPPIIRLLRALDENNCVPVAFPIRRDALAARIASGLGSDLRGGRKA